MASIILIILILSILIFGHELTRFLVARRFGFRTPVFGFGMPYGPYLVIGKKWETEFRISLLLFGAYVSIPELSSEKRSKTAGPDPRSGQFSKFRVWQRAIVVLAGMGFYVVSAWLLLLASANIAGTPKMSIVVHKLSSENHIAANAGVKPGDYIIALDSKQVSNPTDVVCYLSSHSDVAVTVHIQRQDKLIDLSITPNAVGKVGMSLLAGGPCEYKKTAFPDSCGFATQELCALTTNIVRETGMFLINKYSMQSSGNEDQAKKHGVIAIIKFGADIIAQDWRQLPHFLAMLSIDLALINLAPWPGFGGSHLLAILIDAARENPLIKQFFPTGH